jgi:hypothetical protein
MNSLAADSGAVRVPPQRGASSLITASIWNCSNSPRSSSGGRSVPSFMIGVTK